MSRQTRQRAYRPPADTRLHANGGMAREHAHDAVGSVFSWTTNVPSQEASVPLQPPLPPHRASAFVATASRPQDGIEDDGGDDVMPCFPNHDMPSSMRLKRSSASPMLEALSGVSAEDRGADAAIGLAAGRDKARLTISSRHAAIIILILVLALSLSLTLLLQQSRNLAMLSSDFSTSLPVAGTKQSQHGKSGASIAPTADATNGGSSATGKSSSSMKTSAASSPRPSTSATTVDGVNLNTATSAELESIKGIGPVTAQKILDHRSRIGRFTSVDQLLEISGIGTKTLEKIRPFVVVQ